MINTYDNISTISELRFKTKEVLKKAAQKPLFLFNSSQPQAVILSLSEYKELTEALEDYYLSLRAEEYEQEDKKKIKWVPNNQIRKLLQTK